MVNKTQEYGKDEKWDRLWAVTKMGDSEKKRAGEYWQPAVWQAAHVDEDWNLELWGRDELALERRALHFAEMQAAALVLAAA